MSFFALSGDSGSQGSNNEPDRYGNQHGLGVAYGVYAEIWSNNTPENHRKPYAEEKATTSCNSPRALRQAY